MWLTCLRYLFLAAFYSPPPEKPPDILFITWWVESFVFPLSSYPFLGDRDDTFLLELSSLLERPS
ncbi:hypothetical protein A2U01_0096041, partial [Trifolium medium]|nr:hypothetical protein [Trifolium medium]